MFPFAEYNPKEQSKKKVINLIINGQPDKSVTITIRHQLRLTDIISALTDKFHYEYKHIRIFSSEGVEYNREDLTYVKSAETLYVSRGEEFDANSCYGEYEVIRVLGQGGFGRVDLCRHKSTNLLVAIKHMRSDRLDSAQAIDIIFRQTQHLKALNHPNIVKILNFYAPKGLDVVFVMEYLEGGQLLQYLRMKERLPEEEAKTIFRQIVSAIAFCHSKNIVHRDLKLENVLLKGKENLEVKVADFGISGVAQKVNANVKSGTLRYMCPEVLNGDEKGNSPAIDVWAMGCILYHLVVGKMPFNGNTPQEVVASIISGEFCIPPELNLSADCTKLIKRLLDVDPKTRIRVFEIQEHPWIMKSNKLFRMRASKKWQRISGRQSMLKRKSLQGALLQMNVAQLTLPKENAQPLEPIMQKQQKRSSMRDNHATGRRHHSRQNKEQVSSIVSTSRRYKQLLQGHKIKR